MSVCHPNLNPFCSLGVGPITVADPHLSDDISDFRDAIQALPATGGGDLPEYSLYGMKEALETTGEDEYGEYDLMVSGSQMIVITDAPSKQPELADQVIKLANAAEVCIHFFLSDNPTSDGIYPRIASQTHGTLISTFSGWSLARFIETYETNPCIYLPQNDRRKRQAPVLTSSDSCTTFLVSKLAGVIKLSINATLGSIVTITRPDGINSTVTAGSENFAVFSETLPLSGRWSACVDSGTLRISATETSSLDTSIFYLNEYSTGISTTLPQACE